jgi:hypothetical protein
LLPEEDLSPGLVLCVLAAELLTFEINSTSCALISIGNTIDANIKPAVIDFFIFDPQKPPSKLPQVLNLSFLFSYAGISGERYLNS